jgi:hypothetical protein
MQRDNPGENLHGIAEADAALTMIMNAHGAHFYEQDSGGGIAIHLPVIRKGDKGGTRIVDRKKLDEMRKKIAKGATLDGYDARDAVIDRPEQKNWKSSKRFPK